MALFMKKTNLSLTNVKNISRILLRDAQTQRYSQYLSRSRSRSRSLSISESSIIPFLTFPLQNLFAFLLCISAHVCEAASTNVLVN